MAENKEDAVYYSDGEIHFVVTNIKTKHEPTERSNDEILRIFYKRRPYCPNYEILRILYNKRRPGCPSQTYIPNLRDLDRSRRSRRSR